MKADSQQTFKSEFQYFIKIAYLTTVNQYLNFVPTLPHPKYAAQHSSDFK